MSRVANNLTGLIGKTPLLRLNGYAAEEESKPTLSQSWSIIIRRGA